MQIKEVIQKKYGSSIEGIKGEIDNICLQQNSEELADVISFLLKENKQFTSFLEIGAAAGGNARVFADFLKIKNIYIIDNNLHPEHIYRSKNLENLNVKEYIGDSQCLSAKEWARENEEIYDIIYIDGDHSYQGVLNDIENYKNLISNGYLIFHDHFACPEVNQALNTFINQDKNFKKIFCTEKKFGISIFQKVQ